MMPPKPPANNSRIAIILGLAIVALVCITVLMSITITPPEGSPSDTTAKASTYMTETPKQSATIEAITLPKLTIGKQGQSDISLDKMASTFTEQNPIDWSREDEKLAETFANGECGTYVLDAVGLRFRVDALNPTDSLHSHQRVFIVTANQAGRDVQFAGRAIHKSDSFILMLAPTVSKINASAWSIRFGPCYYNEGGADELVSVLSRKGSEGLLAFDFDIIVTWVGTKYLGQKWRLPDRNDNPPFEVMRTKCLSLSLSGDCERHGVTIGGSSVVVAASPSATERKFPPLTLQCLSRLKDAPLCRNQSPPSAGAADVFQYNLFGNGQWRSLFPSASGEVSAALTANNDEENKEVLAQLLQRSTLDDPVGLNHLAVSSNNDNKLVMAWEPPCSVNNDQSKGVQEGPLPSLFGTATSALGAITAEDIVIAMHNYFGLPSSSSAGIQAGKTYTIALFGDSMMVEQFHMWCQLLHGHSGHNATYVKQGKSMGLRWMHTEKTFKVSAIDARIKQRAGGPEDVDSKSSVFHLLALRIRFARSYTTKGGNSVLASVGTIIKQILSVDPDIVAGNLASLHWQQNMRSQKDWEGNVERFAEGIQKSLLRVKSGADTSTNKKERLFYFWGNTMIQMGRTQGLNSGRTNAFNAAARRILGGLKHPHHGDVSPSKDVVTSPLVHYFDPYHLSVARRESSFDGQHWACYHRYGGVSSTITQLWMAHLCHISLR